MRLMIFKLTLCTFINNVAQREAGDFDTHGYNEEGIGGYSSG